MTPFLASVRLSVSCHRIPCRVGQTCHQDSTTRKVGAVQSKKQKRRDDAGSATNERSAKKANEDNAAEDEEDDDRDYDDRCGEAR
jgi:hypothetical protein